MIIEGNSCYRSIVLKNSVSPVFGRFRGNMAK